MFTVLYRWRLKPGTLAEFRSAWCQMTESIYSQWGSLGSRLHEAEDGTVVAYAQWPDRERWLRAQEGPSANEAAGQAMARCIEERHPPLCMTVAEDLLKSLPGA